MEDCVLRVLPALIGQPRFVRAMILDEAVVVGIAQTVDPAQRRFDIGP